jgi:hypothetical protein
MRQSLQKITGMFLAAVYFFGAKVGTSFSRQNVTISKNIGFSGISNSTL